MNDDARTHRIHHAAIVVADVDASLRFWRDGLGFELLMDELTEDTVFEELGYAIPIVREAFELIAAEDRYVRFDTSARPYRLVRVYG